MKLTDITVGMECRVKRGYSIRPAVVKSIRKGVVGVHFTDVDAKEAAKARNKHDLFGAKVRPSAIQAAPTGSLNVYQDRDGNWIGVRTFTYASGAQGVERVVLMKRTQDPFADRENRAEAERRAAEWSKTWK